MLQGIHMISKAIQFRHQHLVLMRAIKHLWVHHLLRVPQPNRVDIISYLLINRILIISYRAAPNLLPLLLLYFHPSRFLR